MGRVFLVGDLLHGDQLLALKTLRHGLLSDSAVERFKQEFRAMTRLRHPNLARVNDYGILEESQLPFITIEYLDGRDLSSLTLSEARPLLPGIIAQLCRALDYIHTRGVLHNDIKPQNIFLLPRGEESPEGPFLVKVMDFGLAQFADGTEEGSRSGTIHYTAPEVLSGAKPEARSDLYSLGVVLYRLATGSTPFAGRDPGAVIRAHRETLPTPPRSLDPSLGAALERLILWLLEKNPEDRPRSAAALFRSLNEGMGTEFPFETRETRDSHLTGAPMVGRESEMAFLRAALETLQPREPGAPASTTPRLVLVGGESGSGKSRLLREFRYQAQTEGLEFLVGHCYETGGAVYQPFLEAFRVLTPAVRESLGGSTGEPADPRLAQTLLPLFPDLAPPPADPGPAAEGDGRARLFEAAAQALRQVSQRRPIVLALEDLHWADSLTIEFLRHLRDRTAGAAFLIIGTYRDDEVGGRPLETLTAAASDPSLQVTLRLSRLALDEVQTLIRSMLALEEDPQDLALMLQRQTAGNPLFIEEVLKALAEEDALSRREGAWRVDLPELGRLEVPRTINETLTRRLARLNPEELRLVRVLSVFHRPLPRSWLARMGALEPAALGAQLARLYARGLLSRTTEAGEEGVSFAHMKTRDLVYRGLGSERARLHLAAAEILEEATQTRGDDLIEELAHHFLLGGDRVKGLEYAERAGDKSARLFAYASSLDFYQKSLGLLPRGDSRRRLALFTKIAGVHTRAANYAEMQDFLNRALRLARTLQDRGREAHLIASIGYGHLLQGHFDLAVRNTRTALTLFESLGDSLGMGRAKNFIATAYARMGQMEEAIPHFTQALEHLEAAGDAWQTVNVRNNLGNVHLCLNRPEEARNLFEAALQSWHQLGDKRGEAMSRANLGQALKDLGRLDEAATTVTEAVRLYRETLDRTHLAVTLTSAAEIHLARGAYDVALELVEEALRIRRQLGETPVICYSLDLQGTLRRLSGDHPAASEAHQEGLRLARESKNDLQEGFLLASVARDALEEEKPKEAALTAEKALVIARRLRHRPMQSIALEVLSAAALATGQLREAASRARDLEALVAHGANGEERFRAAYAAGTCRLAEGQPAAAQEQLERALEIARNLSRRDREAQVRLALARVAEKAGKPERSQEHLRGAAEAYREIATRIQDSGVRRRFLGTGARLAVQERLQKTESAPTPPSEGKFPPVRLLATMYEIGQIINTLRDLTELLNRVLDLAIQIVGAERGLIFLREEASGELKVRVARNLEHETIRDAGEYSQRILREASAGRAIVTVDAGTDERFEEFDSVSLYNIRSLVCVPLRIRDRILGTVYLDSRRPDVLFGEEDVEFLEAFANQASIAIENARLYEALKEENLYLKRTVDARYGFHNIIGNSPALARALERLDRVAESNVPVVIQGESGTGKELVARAIHQNSPRRDRRFVSENVAALPETLLESELFGHVRGAFTGADQDKPGLFDQADGGTLFLDEVGEMSLALQSKLLRVLQEGEVRPVGGSKSRRVDVRVLAATNRELKAMVEAKQFREDLYYRLNVVTINLPPLRQRKEDIPLLVEHFLEKAGRERGARPLQVEPAVLALLARHRWPGNVRELENTLSRLALFATGPAITLADLAQDPDLLDQVTDLPGGRKAPEPQLSRQDLRRALKATRGNRVQAAALLGISRATLFRKLRDLRIKD